ncbi:MAG: DUF58 domain-containing protein [Planctomycetota bacterium]
MSSRAAGADALPPGFLRLLATVPASCGGCAPAPPRGVHAARGTGGPFLFRGHRAYREGDDLRRVDWGVLARHDRVVVREHDAERDARTGCGSTAAQASRPPAAARPRRARPRSRARWGSAAAGGCASACCATARPRRGAARRPRPADLAALLDALAAETPAHRARASPTRSPRSWPGSRRAPASSSSPTS